MDWNSNVSCFTSFGSPSQESFSALLYNLDQFPETKKVVAVEEAQEGVVGGVVEKKKKKKRLSDEQLRSLERSFEEEVKVDPERKMKLSKELGLQPRQIAVWFQNRRARWKTKQLQHLYHNLKQDFDTLSKEKHYLQQEVMKLRSMLREQTMENQGWSMAYMDMFGEDQTAESTSSMGVPSCNNYYNMYNNNNVENFNQISASTPSFWWDDAEAEANHLPFLILS